MSSRGVLAAAAVAFVSLARVNAVHAEEKRALFKDEDDDEVVKRIVEQRALQIGHQVRCVTCQSQNIEESFTEEASEMRKLIRKRLFEGKDEAQIKEELVAVYGESVLYVPQWNFLNALGLFGPAAAFGIAALAIYRVRRIRVPGTSMTLHYTAADELLPNHVLTHEELGAFRAYMSFPKSKR